MFLLVEATASTVAKVMPLTQINDLESTALSMQSTRSFFFLSRAVYLGINNMLITSAIQQARWLYAIVHDLAKPTNTNMQNIITDVTYKSKHMYVFLAVSRAARGAVSVAMVLH